MTWSRSNISGISKILFICILIIFSPIFIYSQIKNSKNKGWLQDIYQNYNEETFMDMDFEPNLATPVVPTKYHNSLSDYILKLAKEYQGYGNVDILRDGEVMLVTIPTDRLFLPNDTVLSDDAEKYLLPILNPIEDPMMFKLVIAMHTDDTGSELYREELSTSRLNSIYDWFMIKIDEGKLNENILIIPFSMGADMPLGPNTSRKNRSENRRLEVYYIPGPKLIESMSQLSK